MFYILGLVLHVIMFHPGVSFAMDTKCAIKSSCSLSGCHQADPMTVNPASNITLNCTIITGGLARDMTWNQALERVKNGSSTVVEFNSTKSGGKYSCRCRTIQLARALEIVAPFTSSPNYINQDKETKIMCVFSGWPLPRTVYWLKNSKLIINGTEDIYIHHSPQWKEHKLKSILRVLHGREEQEGAYLCRATNSIPGWSSSNSSTIEMKYRCPIPKGPTISDQEILARIFSNVSLTCLVDWDPAIYDCPGNLLWYFSEELPRQSEKYNQSLEDTGSKCKKKYVLTIFNVTENDEGTYSCHFICAYRSTTKAAIHLRVFVPPPTEFPTWTEYRTTSSQSHSFLNQSDSKPTETESRRKWFQAALISSAGIVVILVALFVWFVVNGNRTSSSSKAKSYCPMELEFINKLFISHSSKDFGWVTENLISIIEKHSIAYSIHNRDFELGKPIVENMADSVYGSRQVLVVLSENYLASNFCREELHMAVQREADAHDSSLILVTINQLKKKQLPAALRKKRVLNFDKHKKKEDWEEKVLSEILDGELISGV